MKRSALLPKSWRLILAGGWLGLAVVCLAACEASTANLDLRLLALTERAGVEPLGMPELASPALIRLGEMLFWDPELSGNRDVACVTCHHPAFGSGDGLSLPVGTGGRGLGSARIIGDGREFVPRNANPLYNLGHLEWDTLFWDGRIQGDVMYGFENPARDDLPQGLTSALAAQAMFPVLSREEMRGDRGDQDIFGQRNELAWIKDTFPELIWEGLMLRLLAIPEYQRLFQAAYPGVELDQLGFEHAANALAAYEVAAFTSLDSPWDRYLQGDRNALSDAAKHGALLFYGRAGCADCHSGAHLTDWDFYNLAVPHIGPGKGHESPFDFGRARETGDACDLYAFRTPPLRNVAITGPWMHNGAYTSLEAAVRHHLDPLQALADYDLNQLIPELRSEVVTERDVITAALECQVVHTPVIELSEAEFADLIEFLEALTAPSALDFEHLIPTSVPSGLPVGGS